MKFLIKSFLVFSLVLIELSLSTAIANPLPANLTPGESKTLLRPKVDISIEFGRRSRNCEGFGICKITLELEYERRANNGNGQLYLDDVAKNTLVLQIDKSTNVSAACYNTYLKPGAFVVDEEFQVPLEISKKLELIGQKTIPAGKYKIEEIRGILYVYLPMK